LKLEKIIERYGTEDQNKCFCKRKVSEYQLFDFFSFAGSFAGITTLPHTDKEFRLQYFGFKNWLANGMLLIIGVWRHFRLQNRLRKAPLSSSIYLPVQAVSFAGFNDHPLCTKDI
jgi:hypothetical protein